MTKDTELDELFLVPRDVVQSLEANCLETSPGSG